MAGVGALVCRVFGAASGVTAAVALAGYYKEKDSKFSFLKNTFLLNAETEAAQPPKFTKWDFNWDKRNPESENAETSKASRNIILIRHGQYNLEGEEDKDRYLTELGLEQAKITGARLAEMALPYTSISVSRMKRAIQTAHLIQQYLPEVPLLPEDIILNEGSPIQAEPRGTWRPEAKEDSILNEGPPIPSDPESAWCKKIPKYKEDSLLSEGEPIQEEPRSIWTAQMEFSVDGARIEAAFRKYFHRAEVTQNEDSYEIVVCHANVIRYFLCRALQLPPEKWLSFSLRNASMTGIGESGHFPADKLSVS